MNDLKAKAANCSGCWTTHLSSTVYLMKKPAKYLSHENAYELSKELDEAEDVPPPDTYRKLGYLDMSVTAKYAEILVRNYDLPLMAINDLYGRYLMILGYFHSDVC